uniref:Phospholipid-transporting ATPase n=1 Tax=Globodera pallida TaxID=36090 RepID=A0A183C8H2_GLOPA
MDWLRAHLPSYSAIRNSAFASLTSSMSSQQSSVGGGGGGGHAQQKRGSANGAVAPRTIVVNGAQQPQKYCNNQISTCKYNVMTFLPRFLIEQFRRYSNVFFLIIAVLQQIPEVSPTGRYTTAVPFLIILTVSALKEIFEDIKRRRMDIEVNNYKVEVLDIAPALVAGGAKIRVAKWKQLRVGEIIRVKEGQFFPADIVLLSSSEAMGMAYIETAQLDGETNLKIRQAIPNTAELTDMAQLRALNAQIECEPPNRRVNEFAGTLRVANDEKAPLSIGQFLLRGAKLKNCRWVFGVVVYTGHDSRLLMNSTSAPLKTSRIDVMTNQRIVILFLMLVLITVVRSQDFDDPELRQDMTSGRHGNGAQIYEFLTMLATCHSVVPEREESGHIRFQASSPDEAALVRAAQNQGFTFHTRRPNEIVVETGGSDRTFELLNVLVFTSDRKRMSVILREKSADGEAEIKLFCKGADNVIFDRLSKELNDRQMLARCNGALNDYAQKGYRTLCFASAVLDPDIYAQWARDFKTASTAIEEREKQLAAVAEQIECNLRLIAVTAIEDKLQDNVPLTIRTLLAAGIRIWMLTGDKLETAVQIAQSSSLCHKDTELMVLAERSFDVVLAKLHEYTLKSHQFMLSKTAFALVIDGASLHHAVIGEARRVFAELIVNCHSVICCRMTPMQKAEVVEIVKSLGNNKTVMAVGDGANDVAMIQAANVGVGISGVEGLQAASVSDYSIAQFQFLRRLLLVHGTWNFERSVKVILYSFYKNICLYIIELWFAFFSAFSGVTIFERWTIAMFNVTFTALPPIILGLFDRPLSQRMILRHPQLYQSFQQMAFSNDRFFMWVGVSLWHSLLLFFLNFGFYSSGAVWAGGNTGGWLMFGNSLYTFVVATLLPWFHCALIWPLLPLGSDMSGMFMIMVSSPSFWMALIFIPVTTLLFDFVVKSFCTSLRPSPRERFCLREKRRTLVGCNITDLDGSVRREEVRQPYDDGFEECSGSNGKHFDNHYHNQQQQQTLRQRSHEKQPNRPPQKSQHANCTGNAALLQCPSSSLSSNSSSSGDDVQQQQQQQQKGSNNNNLFSHPHSTEQQPHFHLSNNDGSATTSIHLRQFQSTQQNLPLPPPPPPPLTEHTVIIRTPVPKTSKQHYGTLLMNEENCWGTSPAGIVGSPLLLEQQSNI